MGDRGKIAASRKFDREKIFSQTIRHFLGETIAGDTDDSAEYKITTLDKRTQPRAFEQKVHQAYNLLAEI